jgi:nitrous oxide reductase accessory protein NosL
MQNFRFVALAAMLGGLVLSGCSEEDQAAAAESSATDTGDTERYCELLAEINGAAEQVFADVPENPSDEQMMAAWQRLLDEADEQFAEMQEVAPEEIREDNATFVADLRARATTGVSPDPEAAQAAEERERAFQDENCPGGADGS